MSDRVPSRILSMFDEWVVRSLMQDYGYESKHSLELFLDSETRILLDDYETGLWSESPLLVYDLMKTEIETGTPYNSTYLRGDELYADT